ncbi:MAG: murein biosynthesis integral membrane protein MurJ [bacterium]|nr:murein biosynthesis integral membrane protein MurJ [bacterium]MDD5756866.1 murein biosynthesis integral membrane protein MurJ [bacterium]
MSTKIAKSIGTVSGATLLSRVLGYVRDMVVASRFGNGWAADAFYLAFRIPNVLRDLLGEGSLSSGFIPVFSECLVKKGKNEAATLYSACLGILLVILSGVTLLGMIFAPAVVRLIAWGWWNKPDQLALAIKLTRIMFPFIAFISLSALAMGALNSLQVFFIPAAAPMMLSVFEIAAVLWLVPLMKVPIEGLAWGVLLGGLFQFLWQVPYLAKNGFLHRIIFRITPLVRKIGILMIPVAIGSGVRQLNVLIDQVCASFLQDGSIMALYYANRLYQLPLALFGLSIVTVALPAMSLSAAKKDLDQLKHTFSLSIRMTMFTLIPSTIGLIVLGQPIIRLLFEHGSFNAQGTALTALALAFYALGLIFFAGAKIGASAFYALQDTKTPVKIAIAAMVLNTVLNIILMKFLRVGGLALATSISAAFNMAALVYILRQRIGALGASRIWASMQKVLLAAAAMGVVCFFTRPWIIIALVLGVLVYIGMAYLLKIEELKYVQNFFRRQRSVDSVQQQHP